MSPLSSVNAWLSGFFACAAIHYAVHWWLSRHERIFLRAFSALVSGVLGFLAQPFDDRELLDGLARALAARGAAERAVAQS